MTDQKERNNLAADLFVSNLMINKLTGSRLIRKLSESGVIHSHRDLFQPDIDLSVALNDECFSDCDRQRIESMAHREKNRDHYMNKADECLQSGIRSVSWYDENYPRMLKNLDGMPIILYFKGNMEYFEETGNSVAVVGSRKPSNYGLRATADIVRNLALQGTVIISGLARGIDTAAHRAALAAGGKTIAVTACGLDLVYPPENRELFDEIAAKGLLVSEMPPGQEAVRRYFPARNRIMSALSDVVAIMEAGEFSGTLHTASFAIAQGRDVFVLPGSIYSSYCLGNLLLLRDGADILLCADDILSRLAGSAFTREMDEIRIRLRHDEIRDILPSHPEKLKREELSSLISGELSNGDLTLDELVTSTGVPFSTLAPLLSELLISGAVTENCNRFALTFPYT
jgi:DNA processing protein